MIPDRNVTNAVQTMIFRALFGYSLIGKMVVVEITVKDPPAVFISVLVFCPPFELPPDECPQPVETTLCTNAFVIVRPSPITGFSIRIRTCAGIPRFSLIIFLILSLKDWTASFDGQIISLPLNFRTFCERKLKPSLMFVILDFSGECSNPLSIRKSDTKGIISLAITSLLTAVIT